MAAPTRTQHWFRQRPVVAGRLMVPVVLGAGGLAAPVADALDLPWALWMVLLALFLVAGVALSRLLVGLLMGPDVE
ncbi:hypothetical protein [Nocardioides sp. LML1-1-1.1]|uniref:hypothetical protein n=1 Tax=Nocardioides sp. LML1-1-1.1 TaxID=3135248 RepID=UPI00343F9DF9